MSSTSIFLSRHFPTLIKSDEVEQRFARGLVALLVSGRYEGATLVECRRGGDNVPNVNLIVADLDIDTGQREPVHDIRPIERVAIVCSERDSLPSVCPMRDDFPRDLPHLLLVPENCPPSLCLFSMPTEEAIRVTDPFVLLERTRFWFRETAHDTLHAPDQPLDPRFAYSGYPIVLPPFDEMRMGGKAYRGYQASGAPGAPVILELAGGQSPQQAGATPVSVITVVTQPLAHARLKALPLNVAQLLTQFRDMGIDMLALLKAELRRWKSSESHLLGNRCIVVVCMPIERSPGLLGATNAKAFDFECTAEQLAIHLGALISAEGQIGLPLRNIEPDMTKLEGVRVCALDVYQTFHRALARASSGCEIPMGQPDVITLVGAGALGSQIALTAARMGWGRWTVVDPDHLMPHNLARHALLAGHMGTPKAEALAFEISALLGIDAARGVVGAVTDAGLDASILTEAQLVIDASASVPASRWLASMDARQCPCVSVFVNPTGDDLVILWEGTERAPRLDHVEMSYYWMLTCDDDLADHLSGSRAGIFPSGGCREPSMQISQANIGALASIAADRLSKRSPPPDGAIEIWRRTQEGIAVKRAAPARFSEFELDGWIVAISDQVVRGMAAARATAGDQETGGILIGSWDKPRGRVYIVGFCPSPPDSVASCTGFVRGAEGVYRALDSMTKATAANLTYIGEWHTHPPGCASHPSTEDAILLEWIEEVLVYSDVPPLMAIVGSDGARICLGRPSSSALICSDVASEDSPKLALR